MDMPIRNIDDLRSEIIRLRAVQYEQGIELSKRFNSPSAVFSTIIATFKGPKTAESNKNSGFFSQDIVGLISRIVLPFTLNKTLFRHSNFIVKSLVGLASQKASHFITEDSVVSVWDKVKGLFHKKDKVEPVLVYKTVPDVSVTA